jgi:hypothetical protein
MQTLLRPLTAILIVVAILYSAPLPRARSAGVTAGWPTSSYAGARAVTVGGAIHGAVPSYSLSYPPGWSVRRWPDTLATYGQISLSSPSGGIVDVVVVALRSRGPSFKSLIANDAGVLAHATQQSIKLQPGRITQLTGTTTATGRAFEALYLQRGSLVYRFTTSLAYGVGQSTIMLDIAGSVKVPAAAPSTPTPSTPSSGGSCCHCPAWGLGWGNVLTSLDGVAVYSNAGNLDNGCTSAYGISYQCVELVQRYFSARWGYPAIWQGVEAAADMRSHHPNGITFVPNGGSPAPRKGDAVLFYGGAFGHVALVSKADRRAGRIGIVEENWSSTGTATLTMFGDGSIGIRNSTLGSYVVAGWLHSTQNGKLTPAG